MCHRLKWEFQNRKKLYIQRIETDLFLLHIKRLFFIWMKLIWKKIVLESKYWNFKIDKSESKNS